ncbi:MULTISPECIES: tRNA epoxyqueuosine(34) reductase QueG [Thiorhodovibrio]|uniref:tRNA epoxyqueuosine(34) reductase QueG n=1 Tax=Thiorhodovibrio TaxID=61593 RepID=UPI0019136A85|nr:MULTISPECIES: tRNA epoxyqueuosine(34) reductase QueG [Thiorhodovibrio]MBK5969545.1 tRNA epoxyqueuosine(34) reductase QueG [Thiorhodovibrio winogradskyi]WPL13956.1 Epoxyqueuosine reductase [Thiorhodovibrio litoralis]
MTPEALTEHIKIWGRELGFQQLGIAGCDLSGAESHLRDWLARGWHGEMDYMARHGSKRSRPGELLPGTLRVICARMDYLPEALEDIHTSCDHPIQAFISRYALGRDYHKVLRARLKQLALRIEAEIGTFQWRPLVDSAPVMEKPLAQAAGLGWIGKHTNLIHPRAGSWFFLGELYVNLALPVDEPLPSHCGRCSACMDVCPTGAIVNPYQLDARLCISYLTIELAGAIPQPLRPLIGNRIYGCDDCQLVCPWNRFARLTTEADFRPREGLDRASLITLFAWDETEFLQRTQGSAMRRIGHQRWLRNIAVALGNAEPDATVVQALHARCDHPSALVREHVTWALERQQQRRRSTTAAPNIHKNQ